MLIMHRCPSFPVLRQLPKLQAAFVVQSIRVTLSHNDSVMLRRQKMKIAQLDRQSRNGLVHKVSAMNISEDTNGFITNHQVGWSDVGSILDRIRI